MKMTSSTRVYLFSLAIADTCICVCGLIRVAAVMTYITRMIIMNVLSSGVIFSIFLLTFVSIERLNAVIRPHLFSMEPLRAKKAIIIIALATAVHTAVNDVSVLMHYGQFLRVLQRCVLFTCTSVITACYTLIAVVILQKIKSSRKKIGVIKSTLSNHPGTSDAAPSGQHDVAPETNHGMSRRSSEARINVQRTTGESTPATAVNVETATCAKHFKGVFLLFIVTIAFIASWMPVWLFTLGLNVAPNVRRIYLINSVVNPFIYGVASSMFRGDVRQFYRQTRAKLASCCQ